MGAERSRGLHQLGVIHPDLARPAELTADLDQKAIALLLLRRHLVIRDLGVAAEGRLLGHIGLPSQDGLETHPPTAQLSCRPSGASLRAACTLLSRVRALLPTAKARRWPSRTR